MSTSVDSVTISIDGTEMSVPTGTLLIRAAEMCGVQIPRFCDHPLLAPVGACRQCLVEVEGQRKPLASCTTTVTDGMTVHTQLSSPVAAKAQTGVMELLLINHPLDCPVCDKGGECPLQNQAMSTGRSDSRFDGVKRTFPKPIPLSTEVLLDRERCVLCARCTRFSDQIAGDPFIELTERGALQQVGIYENEPFESYFSGNTIQICPVGALTGAAYRFRARPYDLVSTPSVCEHCASGCATRTDHRRGKVLRRLAGDDPAVNEEWNCDKGRWAFTYATEPDRITGPLVRGADGVLAPASWSEALAAAARGLRAVGSNVGVLVGGRSTTEDAYAYAKFARVVLGTNNIDFRSRAHSGEEDRFLASSVAGRAPAVDYTQLEHAPAVLLVGFEPEEESPIIFLRLRKAVRTRKQRVRTLAPFMSAGARKLGAELITCPPAGESAVLDGVTALEPGTVVLVGERLAESPGGFSAVARLVARTGAHLAWVPRRAGDRGALEMGAFPGLLPGGRPVSDAEARRQIEGHWATESLPTTDALDTSAILDAARSGSGLVVGGAELADLPDPRAAELAVDGAAFVVSLELRHSAITERADVVFPVAPVTEKAGSFMNWEGRLRPFEPAITGTRALSDARVLDALATEMGSALQCSDTATVRREIDSLAPWTGPPVESPNVVTPNVVTPATSRADAGEAILCTWRMLLDSGRMQDGEPHLAGTAREPVVRLSPTTASEIGASDHDRVALVTEHGVLTLPLAITDMPDRVVWVPRRSPGSDVATHLGVTTGARVTITAVGP